MAAVAVILGIYFVFIFAIIFVAIAFSVFCEWVFFNKCGEKGWKALIPFYNDLTLVKVADMNWWWVLPLWIAPAIYGIASFLQGFASGLAESDYSAIAVIIYLVAVVIYLVAGLVGLLGIFSKASIYYNICKKFNKSGWFALLFYFFTNIMFLVSGFAKDFVYDKNVETSRNGFIK